MAVRLAMIATTGSVANAGTPACPATVIRRWSVVPALIAPVAQDVDTVRVSQIRVGPSAWYWYPTGEAPAVWLPNQPLTSTSTLIVPTELKTQSASSGPPVLVGPSS